MRIDGGVAGGSPGADAEWDRLLGRIAISLSEGEGSFHRSGVDSGNIASTLTAAIRLAQQQRTAISRHRTSTPLPYQILVNQLNHNNKRNAAVPGS